jgi:xylulokinase
MGVILSAADSLEWLGRMAGKPVPDLTRDLPAADQPAPVMFLPYLSGERTPHNDPHATGGFVGLRQSTTLGDLSRAVMEGVAFAFRDCLRVLNDAGTDFPSALAVGGGAHSEAWLQILATVLNRPIEVPERGDFGAAFGAARLGLCAAENADPVAVCTKPRISHTVIPDPARIDAYTQGYARYRALYPAIKEALR